MATFLSTQYVLIELAMLTGRPPNDPALIELFDSLVLHGHLTPWEHECWWELIRWHEAEKFVKG